MKKNDRTLYYIFLSLGLVMIFISAVIYYYQRHSIGNVIHTTGIIVDTQQRKPNPYRRNSVSCNAKSWFPVVAFRPSNEVTLIFTSKTSSSLYEKSEGTTVDVIYPPGKPYEAKIYNIWINFFKWGIIGIIGLAFSGASLLIRPSSAKGQRIVQ
ncbi:TPA: DUF3592 domain-containing protein [Klebsiella pneumoniae]|nr:DUF3592 domain-containing protein [Klebsiella pneumoniae]